MFTTLPDFTPRDSHSLWYRSSRSPYTPPGPLDDISGDTHNIQHGANQARQRTKLIERSALARLAADEHSEQESSNDDEDDDEDDVDVSFAPRSATLPRPMSPTFQGRSSMAHPRASMDLSNLLSQDGSSFMQSSPAGRRARHS
ncbi:hypothetical protein FPRO03_01503 [Fusarium proliferatum]|nr:hypothetical protein FPRO03_01503 [Fusarium proliferatum]